MMKEFKLQVTFEHFGKGKTIKDSFNGGNIIDYIIEVSEFEGTDEEHHSGTYTEIIELDTTKDLRSQVFSYIYDKDKEHFFSLYDMNDNIILTEQTEEQVMFTENLKAENIIKEFFDNLELKKQKDMGNYSFYKMDDNIIEVDYTGGEWTSATIEVDKIDFDKFNKLSDLLLSLDWK